jgi:hypothetical protein
LASKKLQAEMKGLLKQHVEINHRHVVTMSDEALEKIARSAVIEGEFEEVGGLPVVNGT